MGEEASKASIATIVPSSQKVDDMRLLQSKLALAIFTIGVITISYVIWDYSNTTSQLCAVHHQYLRKDKVKVTYGLRDYDNEYYDAERTLFPNANTYADGGCLDDGSRSQSQHVLYCGKCRITQEEWWKQYVATSRNR